jgi:indolepyruvate ferredoxin oxidoreductase
MQVTLSDRYTKRDGRIVITGVQALVRLMLLQADRDRATGLRTGGFVSGYRGSPLGTLDTAFRGAGELPTQYGIVVKPAINEEMAATAIAGTQQIEQSPDAKVQGVFSLWYGKGPGLDRASDAIRHGNYQGSSAYGGVVLAVGDDHVAKSSSIVCYSDDMVAGVQVPLLYPADAEEIVLFGLHGFAASRLTGSWMAMKIITEVADSTRAVATNELQSKFVLPPIEVPAGGLHNRWPISPLEQEALQQNYRLPAVHDYVRANGLDRIVLKTPQSRIGIVAAGKSWLDMLEALRLLGLDESQQRSLGLALYKPAMIWPMEPEALKAFANGLERIIVVEEKTGLVENQVKSILYGQPNAPAVFGKHKADGSTLFPKIADLTPERIAAELGRMLEDQGANAISERLTRVRRGLSVQAEFTLPPVIRKPFFCSGCPHNRSTVVPEGSRATAGIGCHGLAAYNRPAHSSFAQMGGEGVHWVGLAPFTNEKHVFANMGDGTYFHSGLLAVRQAVAANVNITFKLLYNSAVAMTGGQSVDGDLSVAQLVQQLRAEGVKTIVVSTDDPDRYPAADPVRKLADRIEHRDDLDALQRDLRERAGVSVIVYEQMCATEKRRLRKRGKMVDPTTRVFINELVCEGCGDCSAKSNCLSVEPSTSEFGTKRRINQSSCNKDYSCLTGFCPSFVTVEGGRVRKAQLPAHQETVALPQPTVPAPDHQRVLAAGVGGTGVVTIGALLSMAGHIGDRKVAVLDQVGMAQKGGAVTSHIHIGGDDITALRIPPGEADLVIVCDQVVGNARDVIAAIDRERTFVLANADVSITGDFTQNPSAIADASFLERRLERAAGADRFHALPFTRLAEKLLGDAIGSNLMMVGFAYQKGWLALDFANFKTAVDLNGVGVKMNLAAFEWGRRLAIDAQAVFRTAGMADPLPESIDSVLERRATFLADYQDQAYADRFKAKLANVRAIESRISSGHELSEAVAKSLFKLMAYKDYYEVARLYRSGEFKQALAQQFEGDVKLSFHMAPPLLAKRDKVTGHLRKQRFGGWMMSAFALLAHGKKLRGTAFDPFGYTAERRMERALITEYEELIETLLARLSPANLAQIVEIARLPMTIRGYGHVKDKAVVAYHNTVKERLEALDRKIAAQVTDAAAMTASA